MEFLARMEKRAMLGAQVSLGSGAPEESRVYKAPTVSRETPGFRATQDPWVAWGPRASRVSREIKETLGTLVLLAAGVLLGGPGRWAPLGLQESQAYRVPWVTLEFWACPELPDPSA